MNTTRINLTQWALELAAVTAKRSTCLRRAVGCVLLDTLGHVLSTGYNGVCAGAPHCNQARLSTDGTCPSCGHHQPGWWGSNLCERCFNPLNAPQVATYPNACLGAFAKTGTDLDSCRAIHAEQNALLQCRDVQAIDTCYVTVSPCVTCVKLLLNTSCKTIMFRERYAHDSQAHALWCARPEYEWLDVKL